MPFYQKPICCPLRNFHADHMIALARDVRALPARRGKSAGFGLMLGGIRWAPTAAYLKLAGRQWKAVIRV